MQMLLLLLLTLSPEHKQLLSMVKQGDMIAADELASSVCQLPEDARRKTCQEVLDRLQGSSGPAPELAVKGVKACMPRAPVEPKPAPKVEKAPEPRPAPAARSEPGRGDELRRPLAAEPAPAVDERRPVTAAEPAPSRARDAAPARGDGRRRAGDGASAALPDGDADAAEPTASPEIEVAMATPVEAEVLPELAPLPEPAAAAAGIAATDRGALREALTYYSIGGGLVAVGAVSALAAVGALANGALLVSQLAPLQQQNPQAYQTQSSALWTTWGLLGGAAAGMAALAAGGGVALMWLGGDRVEQL